jgi:hypothetical protein
MTDGVAAIVQIPPAAAGGMAAGMPGQPERKPGRSGLTRE